MIAAARAERGMTQEQLARAVGLADRQSVSRWERGGGISAEKVAAVAAVLQKPVWYFFASDTRGRSTNARMAPAESSQIRKCKEHAKRLRANSRPSNHPSPPKPRRHWQSWRSVALRAESTPHCNPPERRDSGMLAPCWQAAVQGSRRAVPAA